MKFYEIGLSAERHWKTAVFTYDSDLSVDLDKIVKVPYGKSSKLGIVLREVPKPEFKTKSIQNVLEYEPLQQMRAFLDWYSGYYANTSGLLYGQFLPKYLTFVPRTNSSNKDEISESSSSLGLSEPSNDQLINTTFMDKSKLIHPLSNAQKDVVNKIIDTIKPTVLHGITGSGKTRIYTELMIKTLESGKNALLLYPEIALTPQIVQELSSFLPLIVFHSQLSSSERSKLWHKVASSQKPHVIVGPRSAIFLPHSNLGIIIVDEAHESTYKQDSDIHYNGLHVAAGLANIHKAILVLGSATPPVTETSQILSKGGQLVCLHDKAIASNLSSEVEIVDIRRSDLFTKHPLISNTLIDKIQKATIDGKQSLLFINRRGTAKLIVCSSETCDWQANCSRCELPMTFHHDKHLLICHTCGNREKMPSQCPICDSNISQKVLGAKAYVEDVQKIFPSAKIARFDSDSKNEESFINRYQEIVTGKLDIIIGTQQLVKGLDLPKLSVVGVLNADLSLHFPDYSSDERTFQLITQVIGRVGRGHQKSSVVLQTRQPNNPVIRTAISEDWHKFYKQELVHRKQHSFPPFIHVAKLLFREKSMNMAFKKAQNVADQLSTIKTISIDGPLLSFFPKRGDSYYVQIHMKSSRRSSLLKAIEKLPAGIICDIDPTSLL
jgi:primosomal protein N' (replication factor Y)